ncbi:MAG: NAD(P)/FAD-dependent oxidoreductase [Halobacteriales archaeon]
MSIATIPPYNPDRLDPRGGHAVVLGASMAGLLAGRVLSDAYGRVTIIEKDSLEDHGAPRPGVPQAGHPHLLLGAGQRTMEAFFPGFGDDVRSAGGLVIDWATDLHYYDEGGYIADSPDRIPMFAASRPLFDQVVHRHIDGLDGIRIRDGCQFIEYQHDPDRGAVHGVSVRENGTKTSLDADLVVDATGRTSRTATWLGEHGYPSPRVDAVEIGLTYSTLRFERPADDRRMLFVPPSAPRKVGGGAFPIEDGRWLVTLVGVHGVTPPTEAAAFAEFAAELPVPDVRRLIENHAVAENGVHQYPFPSSIWRHYEQLDRGPRNLLVTGDAVASFNPVYGQGMSIAALEARQLQHVLATRSPDKWPRAFYDRLHSVIRLAWRLSAGSDFRFPQTTGPKPRFTDLANWYLSRLLRTAQQDRELAERFARVVMMLDPPRALLSPKTVWQVLSPLS